MSLIQHLQSFASEVPRSGTLAPNFYTWLAHLPLPKLQQAVMAACDYSLQIPSESVADSLNEAAGFWVELVGRSRQSALPMDDEALQQLARLYHHWSPHPSHRMLLLRVLAGTQNATGLRLFCDCLLHADQSPFPPRLLVEIFGDLVRLPSGAAQHLFPNLLVGLEQLHLAGFVLDYANFVCRQQHLPTHPAAPQAQRLMKLLAGLADRLGQLQSQRPGTQEELTQLGRQVTESVALAVALCDALSQIGDEQAVPSLNKALEVEHRRLRVEAAAALTRLGVEQAANVLTAMAADPAERMRVLSYAEELDLLDQVDEQYASHTARCEAHVVMHLGQPSQMGVPPQHIELIHQTELYWPGYEEPQNCHLFQFVYATADGEYTNIAIAGPVVMSLSADLTHLSNDDVLALFAGWHVDHPDIEAIEVDRTVGDEQQRMQRLAVTLEHDEQYAEVIPQLYGRVFEQRVLIAAAERTVNQEPQTGWVLVSDDEVRWLAMGDPTHPLGAGEAFYLFAGRCLMRSFNG